MQPKIGDSVKSENWDKNFKIKAKLGEGGQGSVFLVESSNDSFALKWYNQRQATDDQRSAITRLVSSGPPPGFAAKRFVWPLDLVTMKNSQLFGYLMPLIDTKRFSDLEEVWKHKKPEPGMRALCEISYKLAESYRALHKSGYCYRDVSHRNLMFNSQTGDILISDNDNVEINRQSVGQV